MPFESLGAQGTRRALLHEESQGEIAALEDEYERRRREEEAALWKEERERLEELVAPVEELCEQAEVLVRATLIAAGYRRHNRGEWRKRRVQEQL